jgi:hypothetical protein
MSTREQKPKKISSDHTFSLSRAQLYSNVLIWYLSNLNSIQLATLGSKKSGIQENRNTAIKKTSVNSWFQAKEKLSMS